MLANQCELVSLCPSHRVSGKNELTPNSKRGGAVDLEDRAGGKAAFLLEMVEDRSLVDGEPLQPSCDGFGARLVFCRTKHNDRHSFAAARTRPSRFRTFDTCHCPPRLVLSLIHISEPTRPY